MDNIIQQKPCPVQTPQGFTISYNNKFLYSKYAPSRAILNTIQNLTLLPGTIILCLSPVMNYGLKELAERLPENCIMLGCEFDSNLLDYINSTKQDFADINNFSFLTKEEALNLPPILTGPEYKLSSGFVIPAAGHFKRVISIDFSAGTSFNAALYKEFSSACVNAMMTFWSNRVTLTKFGRLYSRNLFKNLKTLPSTTPIQNFMQKVSKPIIVCGAGESLEKGINDFKDNSNNYYIICVDTSLHALLQHNIVPDAVFVEEAQFIISKAFIGCLKEKTQVFCGLSSLVHLSHNIENTKISYYTTLFTHANFLDDLDTKGLLPATNKPFGSVGLTAVHYALKFRKNESVPVFCYGLDFAYSAGITHTKGAMSHINRLINHNKLNSLYNFASSYNQTAIKVNDINSNPMYTSQVMQNYANMFKGLFSDAINLFDSRDCGIDLNLNKKKPQADVSIAEEISITPFEEDYKNKIAEYLNGEKDALTQLKDTLTGKIKLPQKELEEHIKKLAAPREYLYLHFPDGTAFNYSQSFLNRIRTEIETYLKILN